MFITTRRSQFALKPLEKLKNESVKLLRLFHIGHMVCALDRDALDPANLLFKLVSKAMECDLILLTDHKQCWNPNGVQSSPGRRIEGELGSWVEHPGKGRLREDLMYALAGWGIFRRGNEGWVAHQSFHHVGNIAPTPGFSIGLLLASERLLLFLRQHFAQFGSMHRRANEDERVYPFRMLKRKVNGNSPSQG